MRERLNHKINWKAAAYAGMIVATVVFAILGSILISVHHLDSQGNQINPEPWHTIGIGVLAALFGSLMIFLIVNLYRIIDDLMKQ